MSSLKEKTPFGSPTSARYRFKTLFGGGGSARKEPSSSLPKSRGRTGSLDAIASLDMLQGSPEPVRSVKDGVFDHRNTSTKTPDDISKEVIRVLSGHSVTFHQNNYKFFITGDAVKIAELSEGRRSAMEMDREEIFRPDVASSRSIAISPPRVIENDYEDTGDSSDGGARDSLEESPEDLEELASPGRSSSPSGKQVRFELEICGLGVQLHGLRLKRLQGDIWLYKDFCDRILSEMRL